MPRFRTAVVGRAQVSGVLRRPRFWAIYLGVGVTAIGAYYLLPEAGRAQAGLLDAINVSGAIGALVTGLRTHGKQRMIWLSLGVAMTFSASANIPYYAYPLATGHPLPFPTAVDAFWLGTYPCFSLVLVGLIRGQRREDRRGDALDAAIFITGGAALMWEFVLRPVVMDGQMALAAHMVAVAYPSMDLLVFALLVRLVVATTWRNGAMRLLTGSFVSLLAGDTIYALQLARGTYHFGGIADACWMLSYLLIGVAAAHPQAGRISARRASPGRRLSAGRLVFLSTAVLTGPILILVHHQDFATISLTTTVSFVLVMARVTGLNKQLAALSHELHAKATTDGLTGLANRTSFHDAVAAKLGGPSADESLAVLFVDLDDFKDVNDTLGHAAGDELLRTVASRLGEVLRPADLVARLGGDEFAIMVCRSGGRDAVLGVAQRVVATLAAPVSLPGHVVQVGASVGVAIADHRSTLIGLLREADVAMYSAKRNGKSRVEHYDPDLERAADELVTLKAQLLSATERGELVVEYQPLFELATRRVVGVEALVRWQHPVRGLLPPSTFISAAEDTGAIVDIGRFVLETAASQVRYWQIEFARPDLSVSVNASVHQLERPQFVAEVTSVLAQTGLPPKSLIVEVTESVLASADGGAAVALAALREIGVRVALDDFGTGYSSIGYLRRLPVDILKVDRSFISGDHSDQGEALLAGIVDLGLRLGLEVLPEGIERTEHLEHVQSLGCRIGQGFLLSRPAPPATIASVLAQSSIDLPRPRTGYADQLQELPESL